MPIPSERDKSLCCGCMACMNICPCGAISPVKDEKGFVYPVTDAGKCTGCGLCEKVCDFVREDRGASVPSRVFSLAHKDRKVLSGSASGGAFTALSDAVLADGGIVAGTVMDDGFNLRFVLSSDPEGRDRMRRSKYVQSETGEIYSRIKELLDEGKKVLFVGAPCQTGGLLSFLAKPYEGLVCVDFICHGVPSNDFFKEHIAYLERRYSAKAEKYYFRSKKFGWRAQGIDEIVFAGGRKKSASPVQAYTRFFYSNSSLRPSCLGCTYRRPERVSDLTIGDFWGVERITGKKNRTGASLVFVNTGKGERLMGSLDGTRITLSEIPPEKVKYRIAAKEVVPSFDPEVFWETYLKGGYEALVERYTDTSLRGRTVQFLKRSLRRFIGFGGSGD